MAKKLFEKGNKFGKGRPKGSGYVQICRDYAEKRGWQKLIDLANGLGYKAGVLSGKVVEIGPDLDLQFQATKTLIEYGYGKPTQALQVSGDVNLNLIDAVKEARAMRGKE